MHIRRGRGSSRPLRLGPDSQRECPKTILVLSDVTKAILVLSDVTKTILVLSDVTTWEAAERFPSSLADRGPVAGLVDRVGLLRRPSAI